MILQKIKTGKSKKKYFLFLWPRFVTTWEDFKKSPLPAELYFYNEKKEDLFMFKSWKTSLSGVATALPQLLLLLGVPIGTEVAGAFSTLGLFLIGIFAKDSNQTGV